MGTRLRRNAQTSVVAVIIALGLVMSALLAYATTAPKGNGGSGYPGTTICKPGYGYGDKNHCHTGPPGQHKNKKQHHANRHH
jgi:hypothetical protein